MGIFRRLSALVAAVVLSLNLCAFAANEIYVKNRPFKGSVSTYEGQLWVELPAFAKAIGANLVSNPQGGHALSLEALDPSAANDVQPNTVMVAGTLLPSRLNGEIVEVPLQEAAKLLNAKVVNNKALGTIDVNVSGPVKAYTPPPAEVASAKEKTEKKTKGNPRIAKVHGKVTLEGANQVGLFEGGSATVPYKVGKVDAKGNYVMEIDLDKDLHDGVADMRFFLDGAFEQCHGRCNFIHLNRDNSLDLSPYGTNDRFLFKDNVLEYTESRE